MIAVCSGEALYFDSVLKRQFSARVYIYFMSMFVEIGVLK